MLFSDHRFEAVVLLKNDYVGGRSVLQVLCQFERTHFEIEIRIVPSPAIRIEAHSIIKFLRPLISLK